MPRSRSRDHDVFAGVVTDCVAAFSFLTEDLGFAVADRTATARGFSVRFRRARVGVEVGYEIGDVPTVDVCLLGADGAFPGPPGEMRPDTLVNRFDLIDIEAQAGIAVPPDPAEYAIPTRDQLAGYARRLRACAEPVLLGDTSRVAGLRARVLERAREAAFAKWGVRASEFGW